MTLMGHERVAHQCFWHRDRRHEKKKVAIAHYITGGVCINEATFHVAQENRPFGGSANSGIGKTHGPKGFRTFSNQQAVYSKGKIDLSKALFPPYGSKIHKLLAGLLIR
jgi:coniferyl-aldehyde dehydrogenase